MGERISPSSVAVKIATWYEGVRKYQEGLNPWESNGWHTIKTRLPDPKGIIADLGTVLSASYRLSTTKLFPGYVVHDLTNSFSAVNSAPARDFLEEILMLRVVGHEQGGFSTSDFYKEVNTMKREIRGGAPKMPEDISLPEIIEMVLSEKLKIPRTGN